MLMSCCHGGVGTDIHPDMAIAQVHSTFPYESRVISKQDASCKLCVYNAFCESRCQNTTLAGWSGGVGACTRWMWYGYSETSADKWNTDTFSTCKSPNAGSEISFHSSQYEKFSKARPYLSRHSFLDIH
jgi:hypothetical protein